MNQEGVIAGVLVISINVYQIGLHVLRCTKSKSFQIKSFSILALLHRNV